MQSKIRESKDGCSLEMKKMIRVKWYFYFILVRGAGKKYGGAGRSTFRTIHNSLTETWELQGPIGEW